MHNQKNLTEVLLDLENLVNSSSIGNCNGDSQLFVQLPHLMGSTEKGIYSAVQEYMVNIIQACPKGT